MWTHGQSRAAPDAQRVRAGNAAAQNERERRGMAERNKSGAVKSDAVHLDGRILRSPQV
jgi:hypothetical protein